MDAVASVGFIQKKQNRGIDFPRFCESIN